ncbi:MAG TPA: ATP-binding protein [Longimicrobiales bacterium]|nr:ATP-binding protein [Longimicrobiales bacterium]
MSTHASHHAYRDPHGDNVIAVADTGADEISGLRATIELAPVGLAHFDADGRFLLVNAHLCAILGYPREELLALSFDEITHHEERHACASANARLLAGEIPSYGLEKRFVRRDGSFVWTRVIVSAVRDTSGKVAFFIGVAEDISEQKAYDDARAAEHELAEHLLALEQEARSRAERANRMRDDVLAVVAHDLRNPLHTLQLSAASMAEPGISAQARERQAELIYRVIESMDHLIGELLDIGRLETGNFPISLAPVRLRNLLDEAMEMFQPQADEHHILLTREHAPHLGTIECDREQLMRVFSNLIGNAVKFTPANGRVSVRARHTSNAFEVSVTDTGPGIPADDLAHVFDRFWQADRTRRFGTGLGLVIAKGIVESHGGSIRADSVVGRGSCFEFQLPAR